MSHIGDNVCSKNVHNLHLQKILPAKWNSVFSVPEPFYGENIYLDIYINISSVLLFSDRENFYSQKFCYTKFSFLDPPRVEDNRTIGPIV